VNDLSLRQLQYVVAVADTLGFHKAADRCHASQPTLSTQVQQLESVLGVKLFERDRRRVLLTSAGADISARARRVLIEVDDLIAAATRLHEPFAGTLRVGVIPTIAPYLLPEIMPKVGAKYPRLSLVFREERTADIVRDVDAGTLDLGLLALEADLGGCANAEIAKDPFVAAMPKGHPLDEGHCLRDQALALCGTAGADDTGFRATSLSTLAQMVSSGAGITLLPALAVAVENRRGQLEIRPFVRPVPGRTIALIWRPSSPFAAVFRELAKTFRAASTG